MGFAAPIALNAVLMDPVDRDIGQVEKVNELGGKCITLSDSNGSIVDKDGSTYVQDLCTETLAMTEDEPGTWDNPYMQIGPTDFELTVAIISA